ncbi:SDR family NAD(P)-dependent oxidoreductase [Sphingobacterium sp.]|jgi:NADP-dependent 3-hydroxy acid dehydrogenase YdfG|uniref:SDR family NAD(P)-dependent oxidoreductase n=1 Tax=Sphingobacterium sp. TaxID=341027 RepID=UPI00289D9FB1|nr:SDR family NAD(P)-dependent oxidoreductase [Sphingobacterium sp.]
MKTALITGVSTKIGLGYAIAEELGKQGFHVIIAGRKLDQVEIIANDLSNLGISASPVRIDLLDRKSIADAAKQVQQKYSVLDVLINNAALMLDGSATTLAKDLDEFNAEFETNVTGTWSVTQQFYPMIAASGQFFRDGNPLPW